MLARLRRWNSGFAERWDGLWRAWSRICQKNSTSQEMAPFAIVPTAVSTRIVFESRWDAVRRSGILLAVMFTPFALMSVALILLWASLGPGARSATDWGVVLVGSVGSVSIGGYGLFSAYAAGRLSTSLRIDLESRSAAIGTTFAGKLREPPKLCGLDELRVGVHRLDVRVPSGGASDSRTQAFGIVAHIADRRFVLCCLKKEAEVAEYAAILPKAVYERLDWNAEPIQIRVRWSPRVTMRGLRPNVVGGLR